MKAKFVFVMHSNSCVDPKLLFYIWYAAIYDKNLPVDVKISSKNTWPLPELGHITPNVEWFSVVRPKPAPRSPQPAARKLAQHTTKSVRVWCNPR